MRIKLIRSLGEEFPNDTWLSASDDGLLRATGVKGRVKIIARSNVKEYETLKNT